MAESTTMCTGFQYIVRFNIVSFCISSCLEFSRWYYSSEYVLSDTCPSLLFFMSRLKHVRSYRRHQKEKTFICRNTDRQSRQNTWCCLVITVLFEKINLLVLFIRFLSFVRSFLSFVPIVCSFVPIVCSFVSIVCSFVPIVCSFLSIVRFILSFVRFFRLFVRFYRSFVRFYRVFVRSSVYLLLIVFIVCFNFPFLCLSFF